MNTFTHPTRLLLHLKREGIRQLILKHFKSFGGRATAAEIVASVWLPARHIAPRINELVKQGRLRDTGNRVPTKGRPAVVYALASAAQENDCLAVDF